MKIWVLVYILTIAFIEFANLWAGILLTALASALLILWLVNHYQRADQESGREILLILTIAPLIRLAATVIPLEGLPLLYRYVVVGIPVLLAEILIAMHLQIPIARLGFSRSKLRQQLARIVLIQVTTIVFSFIGYLQVRPSPLLNQASWHQVLLSIIILAIFVALVEEVFFRGLLLSALENIFGGAGLFISALIYMMMYWGTRSWGYVLLMAVVGVFFGWHVKRTQSLWGVTIAHCLIMVGILIYWPLF